MIWILIIEFKNLQNLVVNSLQKLFSCLFSYSYLTITMCITILQYEKKISG